jgi:FkbM family methyltransferase
MPFRMKDLVRAIMSRTPYRIVRDNDQNRFQAIEACLRGLKARGFSPSVVIDGGAHLGSFSMFAKSLFPDATFHLIEPQSACISTLRELCAAQNFILHECALAEHDGRLQFPATSEPGTGAHVLSEHDSETVPVAAQTLDTLFAQSLTSTDRVFLKMDLQGYELHALRGGSTLLPSIEVILTEVSFFFQQSPPVSDVLAFLNANGFQLYDVASLSGRTRDNRLREGDFLFARKDSSLLQDQRWS